MRSSWAWCLAIGLVVAGCGSTVVQEATDVPVVDVPPPAETEAGEDGASEGASAQDGEVAGQRDSEFESNAQKWSSNVPPPPAPPAPAPPPAPPPPPGPPKPWDAIQDNATEADIAEAREQFKEGLHAYESGNYAAADQKFSRSYELSGQPALLYNRANVRFKLGDRTAGCKFLALLIEHDPNFAADAERLATKESCP